MKISLSLVLAALLFVVLGCSLDRFTGKDDTAPTPVSEKSSDSKSDDKSDSSGGSLTMDNYEKVKTGMSYDDVTDILGSKGTETRSSKVGTTESKSYKWEGDKYVRIYVNFRDDKVTSKSQSGLRGSSSSGGGGSDISMEKYEKINDGMSISEVEEIIGSKGEETSSSSIGKSTYKAYRWKGEKFSFISVRFKDDKVNSKSQYGLK